MLVIHQTTWILEDEHWLDVFLIFRGFIVTNALDSDSLSIMNLNKKVWYKFLFSTVKYNEKQQYCNCKKCPMVYKLIFPIHNFNIFASYIILMVNLWHFHEKNTFQLLNGWRIKMLDNICSILFKKTINLPSLGIHKV